jgi:hypothetical protein
MPLGADRTRDLLAELRGVTCRCGATKRPATTFCPSCYFSIPRPLRTDLYRLFGEGYEAAYDRAVTFLTTHTTHSLP